MGMTDQVIREVRGGGEDANDARLRRIRDLLAEARHRDSDEVLDDIARVLGERVRPAEIYQKPLG
jgi:hypothetical protein